MAAPTVPIGICGACGEPIDDHRFRYSGIDGKPVWLDTPTCKVKRR